MRSTEKIHPEVLESRKIEKETTFPEYMTPELMDEWGDGIPTYSADDERDPEWGVTPVIPLDLKEFGFGEILVKNEADRKINPTGTMKDRPAWEFATLYRDFARALYLKLKTGALTKDELKAIKIPRFSLITSGNEGIALAERFKMHNCPPPKLIVDAGMNKEDIERLRQRRVDLYRVDLSKKELTADDIRAISNNVGGVNATDLRGFEPQAIFYDWLVNRTLNSEADRYYVPSGSGRLAENFVYWQNRTLKNETAGQRDPRLTADVAKVISADIIAAQPEQRDSIADKLTADFRPFLVFEDDDIRAFIDFQSTGRDTKKETIDDQRILAALEILSKYKIAAEPSSAAALGCYMKQYEEGEVGDNEKVMVINTGAGLTGVGIEARKAVGETLEPSA